MEEGATFYSEFNDHHHHHNQGKSGTAVFEWVNPGSALPAAGPILTDTSLDKLIIPYNMVESK